MKRMFFGLGPSNSGKSIISRAISMQGNSMQKIFLLRINHLTKLKDYDGLFY